MLLIKSSEVDAEFLIVGENELRWEKNSRGLR
jgi:hypothetical protein